MLIHRDKDQDKHPVFKRKPLLGERASDKMADWVGSWTFIILILVFIAIWMSLNMYAYFTHWDPYPFILLNFALSCLAALQAPVILMSQKRQETRDRIQAKYDYQVNRKAEREIADIQKDLEQIKTLIRDTHGMVKKNTVKTKK